MELKPPTRDYPAPPPRASTGCAAQHEHRHPTFPMVTCRSPRQGLFGAQSPPGCLGHRHPSSHHLALNKRPQVSTTVRHWQISEQERMGVSHQQLDLWKLQPLALLGLADPGEPCTSCEAHNSMPKCLYGSRASSLPLQEAKCKFRQANCCQRTAVPRAASSLLCHLYATQLHLLFVGMRHVGS